MKSAMRCAPFDIALSVIKTAWRYTPMRSVSLSQGEFILFFSSMIITESITRQKEVERRMNTEECKVYISHQNTSSDQQKTEDLNPSARICFDLNILTKSTSRVCLCASDTALCAPVWPPVSKSLSVFLPSPSLQVIDCWWWWWWSRRALKVFYTNWFSWLSLSL